MPALPYLYFLPKARYNRGVKKLIAIVGPTASGKTSLGIYLAQKLGGEVISADSRQVYKGLDIGTGKVTKKEMAGVPHHLLDVASPRSQFTVDQFVKKAERAYSGILKNLRIPIVVGGTGLYVDMLTGRMSYPNVGPNPTLRKQLERKTAEQLFAMLKKADPARAAAIDRHNPRRLVRALEIAKAIGQSPITSTTGTTDNTYDVLWLGLDPGQDKLNTNIGKRLRARLNAGMVAEAKRLHKQGLSYKRMEELGLEYRYVSRLLQNKLEQKEFETQLEQAIRAYTKRQRTWFKRNKSIVWVSSKADALKLAKNFLGGR